MTQLGWGEGCRIGKFAWRKHLSSVVDERVSPPLGSMNAIPGAVKWGQRPRLQTA